jgi:GGDEF domain-containing protein
LGFSVHPGEAGTASELMQAADTAMYRVKRAKIGVAGSERLTR